MHRIRALLVVPIAILLAAGLIACGGDDGGGDEDPQQVLDETFSGEHDFSSGNLDASFKLSAEGDQGGSFDASVSGPFQSADEEGGFPKFDLDADVSIESPQQDFSVTAGAVSTGDRGFIDFQDTNYEVDPATFKQFTSNFSNLQQQSQKQGEQRSLGEVLQELKIDPSTLLTDLENEGNEDVEGTETIHISGQADVPQLADTLTKLADQAGSSLGGRAPSAQQLSQFEDSIKGAELDVFTGADDKTLRKLDANIEIEPGAAVGGIENANLEFSITFSELGESQSIAAPENPQPLSQLLEQYGITPGALGQAFDGAGEGGAGGGAGGGGAGGGGGGGAGAPSAPSDDATQAYLECLQTAEGSDALQKCSELLQ